MHSVRAAWKITLFLTCLFGLGLPLWAQSRWKLDSDGGITWEVPRSQAHQDHIEMSGRKVSAIITYGVRESGALTLSRHVVFPSLRTIPNDTHASLNYIFGEDATPRFFLAGRLVTNEVVTRVHPLGLMTIVSTIGKQGEIAMTRVVFPSTNKPLVLEKYIFTNHSGKETTIEVENAEKIVRTNAARGARCSKHDWGAQKVDRN